jgi:hypothetical protein
MKKRCAERGDAVARTSELVGWLRACVAPRSTAMVQGAYHGYPETCPGCHAMSCQERNPLYCSQLAVAHRTGGRGVLSLSRHRSGRHSVSGMLRTVAAEWQRVGPRIAGALPQAQPTALLATGGLTCREVRVIIRGYEVPATRMGPSCTSRPPAADILWARSETTRGSAKPTGFGTTQHRAVHQW